MDLTTLTVGQRQSVEHLAGPLLICAGAGSGKTFTLTQRIAYALDAESKSGIEGIDNILAITFTEKAAAEIRSRVRSTLRAAGMGEQALKADGAWISTIHGMCSRILHAHAFELGLDPTFAVLDSVQEAGLRKLALEAVLDRSARDIDDCYGALFAEYGANDLSGNSVGPMVSRIISEAASLTEGLDAISLGPTPALPTALARLLVVAFEDIAETGTPKQVEKARAAVDDLQAYLLSGTTDWEVFAPVLENLGRPAATGAAKESVFEAQCLMDKAFSELNFARSYSLTRSLLSLAREVEQEYEARKLTANMVDTDGLLRLTLAAFFEHPAIAERYRNQFKLVMVDEFQDTNQLQIDMISQIAGDQSVHLCTVGDSQQSIYRFRGADVEVYAAHKQAMRSTAVSALYVELADNFRSHADILAFVRAVCGQGGYFSEPFLDLHAKRDEDRVVARGAHYKSSEPRIDVALTKYARGTSIDDAKRVEADYIALRFSELRAAGHQARDMVVLLGSMTRASIYASALRAAGFDCLIAGGSGFFEAQEVKLVGRLLKMLANPNDSESLFAVLSSEMLTLSADDFLDLTTMRQEPDGRLKKRALPAALLDQANKNISSRVRFVIEVFERAWAKLGSALPSRVLGGVLVDSGWLSRLEVQGTEGQAIAGNVIKSLRIVENIEKETGFDMAQVAQKFAKLSSDRERPGALMVEGLNAVRIMTVHASKGLEFPIVAVGDCYAVSEKDSQLLMLSDAGRLYISLKPQRAATVSPVSAKFRYKGEEVASVDEAATPAEFRAVLLRRLLKGALEEKRRLFYVAATRASEALLIAMTCSTTYAPIQDDIRQGLFGEEDFPLDAGEVSYGGSEPLRFTPIDAAAVLALEAGDGSITERMPQSSQPIDAGTCKEEALPTPAGKAVRSLELPLLEECERLDVRVPERDTELFSYSSIANHSEAGEEDDVSCALMPDASVVMTPENAFFSDVDKATDFGSALHRLAQLVALRSVGEALARFDSVAATYGIKDTVRLRSAFERWVSSKICTRAMGFAHHMPEVPFCVAVGDGFLEGEIDLLCTDEKRSHAFIVDYKTGGFAAETPEMLHEKHLLQAQCYAYAVLLQGFDSVEFAFVRVERDDPCASDTLQAVPYGFTRDDREELECLINVRAQLPRS